MASFAASAVAGADSSPTGAGVASFEVPSGVASSAASAVGDATSPAGAGGVDETLETRAAQNNAILRRVFQTGPGNSSRIWFADADSVGSVGKLVFGAHSLCTRLALP